MEFISFYILNFKCHYQLRVIPEKWTLLVMSGQCGLAHHFGAAVRFAITRSITKELTNVRTVFTSSILSESDQFFHCSY